MVVSDFRQVGELVNSVCVCVCVCVCVLVAQSCLTLRDPMDYSPPGSSIHGLLQARILEWVAIGHNLESQKSLFISRGILK